MKKLLVACEWSGLVRDAFLLQGWDAWSCDLEESNSERHICEDVRKVIKNENWDLMIAFPPCTHLAVSGAAWFAEKRADGRQQRAIDFFLSLTEYGQNIPHWCVENPVSIMSRHYRKPDQYIHPYQFGHNASKKTCLWLHNLPRLKPTKYIAPERYVKGNPRWGNQAPSGADKRGPSPDRGKLRGKTYSGVAKAMADQWSKYLREKE